MGDSNNNNRFDAQRQMRRNACNVFHWNESKYIVGFIQFIHRNYLMSEHARARAYIHYNMHLGICLYARAFGCASIRIAFVGSRQIKQDIRTSEFYAA